MSANQTHSKHAKFLFGSLVLLLALLALTVISGNSAGEGNDSTTLYVDDDAGEGGDGSLEQPFNTIQEALNASQSGDTIRVFEGMYYEQVVLNRSVALLGNGTDETILEAPTDGVVASIFADNCTISALTITGGAKDYASGLFIESNNNTISNLVVSDNYYGIRLLKADGNRLINNTCMDCEEDSIYLSRSNNNTLVNNTTDRLIWDDLEIDSGILLSNSNNCVLDGNRCGNISNGIHIGSSVNTTLKNNILTNCGIRMSSLDYDEYVDHSIDDSNIVNGFPVYFGLNLVGETVPKDVGQIILVNCSDMIITSMDFQRASMGIALAYSTNISVIDTSCSNSTNGMYIFKCDNITISNCHFVDNHFIGLDIFRGQNITVEHSKISKNGNTGIDPHQLEDSTFFDNEVESNGRYGFHIYGYNNRNLIAENVITNNRNAGLFFESRNHYNRIEDNEFTGNGVAMDLWDSDWNEIKGNSIVDGVYMGLRIRLGSSDNRIHDNRIKNCVVGFSFEYSSINNSVHYNTIMGNSNYGIDATKNEGYSIDATDNYWGDDSGPFHVTKNPDGKGDTVTDDVIFDPWIGKDERTLYVDDDAGEGGNGSIERPFMSIQDAVDAAFDGDTIRVFDGEYIENVVVDVPISIIGNGSDTTLLRDDVNGVWAMDIRADGVTIMGFTITEARRTFPNAAGLKIDGNDAHIYENVFVDNDIGIYFSGSDSSSILNNTFQENGYGIKLEYGSKNNEIHNNNITMNDYLGIDASTNEERLVHAENNWWGDESGPFHLVKNPQGKGDEVSDFVEFDPWIGKGDDGNDSLYTDIVLTVQAETLRPGSSEPVNFTCTIRNNGTMMAEGISFHVRKYIQGVDGDGPIYSSSFTLAPDEKRVIFVVWLGAPYGYYYEVRSWVSIDPANESDTTNNEVIIPFDMRYPSNEFGVKISYEGDPITLSPVGSKTISYSVTNSGIHKDYYIFNASCSQSNLMITMSKRSITLMPNQIGVLSLNITWNSSTEMNVDQLFVNVTVTSNFHFDVNDTIITPVSQIMTEDSGDSSILPAPPAPLVGVIIVSSGLVGFGAILAFHEPFRYSFLGFLVPLYTRLEKEDLETLENRKEILGFIKGRPGANYTSIMHALEIGNGTLTYHLKVLEDNRMIKARSDANKKRFYPYKFSVQEKEERIIGILKENPGLNQKDIVKILRLSRRKTGRRLSELVEEGKIRIEKKGRENHYFLATGTRNGGGTYETTLTENPEEPPDT